MSGPQRPSPEGAATPRRLLLVANPFPPLASGGNARQLRFARYLPESGWDVTVLTVRATGPAPVPEELRIVRAAAPAPDAAYWFARRTVRGLRSAGRRAPGDSDVPPTGTAEAPLVAAATAAPAPEVPRAAAGASHGGVAAHRFSRRGVVNDWLFVPDEWVGWIAPAVQRGRQLLREERFDAIMSSFPRPSTELVASILARDSGLPWLADYRDPWATRHLRRYPTPLHRRAHFSLEEWALRPAAAVTTTAGPIAETLRRRFPNLADRVYVLPNGYDPPSDSATPQPPPVLGDGSWLVHTGRLYGRSSQLERMLRAFATLPADVHWLFVGIEGAEVRRLAAGLGVGERVHTVPFVPHDQALAYQRAGDGLVLITGDAPEALSSKVFEYLVAGRPIFAFVPQRSAAHDLLAQTGGAVLAPQDREPDAALREFVDGARRGALPPPDPAVVAQYDGRRLTRRLAGLLDCLVDQRRRRGAVTEHPGERS